eukprot:gene2940-1922_t
MSSPQLNNLRLNHANQSTPQHFRTTHNTPHTNLTLQNYTNYAYLTPTLLTDKQQPLRNLHPPQINLELSIKTNLVKVLKPTTSLKQPVTHSTKGITHPKLPKQHNNLTLISHTKNIKTTLNYTLTSSQA